MPKSTMAKAQIRTTAETHFFRDFLENCACTIKGGRREQKLSKNKGYL